jgi:hypothetical protein
VDMEHRPLKRFWIFSRRRREKIDPGELPTKSIPAHKAGGNPAYGAFGAVYEWFLLDDEHIGVLDEEDRVCEETGTGEAPTPTPAPAETIAELESYPDVTLQIYNRLLEAERLASPDDFQDVTYDMGNAIGYVRILRDIWLTQAAQMREPIAPDARTASTRRGTGRCGENDEE